MTSPRIDVPGIDAVIRGTAIEVRLHVIVEVADHFDGRCAGAQSLGRDVPDHRAISAGISLSGHKELSFGIDGTRTQARPNRLSPGDDRIVGVKTRLAEHYGRFRLVQRLSRRHVVDGDSHVLDTGVGFRDEKPVVPVVVGQPAGRKVVQPLVRLVRREVRLSMTPMADAPFSRTSGRASKTMIRELPPSTTNSRPFLAS